MVAEFVCSFTSLVSSRILAAGFIIKYNLRGNNNRIGCRKILSTYRLLKSCHAHVSLSLDSSEQVLPPAFGGGGAFLGGPAEEVKIEIN